LHTPELRLKRKKVRNPENDPFESDGSLALTKKS
jgi:hypothetical protein